MKTGMEEVGLDRTDMANLSMAYTGKRIFDRYRENEGT